ncbi:restriction endonuclease [Kitasatospora sp. NPDC048296]|uniref:restriction endonuclease n=1 Tax=Kitasatospora sp. NPDC048296 TaxID=3364048 RepID=UPI0037184E4B
MIIEFADPDRPANDRLTVVARQVRPVRYRSRELRRSVGDLIGRTGHDDLLAGALWLAEGQAARSVTDEIVDWESNLSNQISILERDLKGITRASIKHEATQAATAALAVYRRELAIISAARVAAEGAFERLRDRFGSDVTDLFTQDRPNSPAEEVFDQWLVADQAIDSAVEQYNALNAEYRRLMSAAARREAFAATDCSISQAELESLDGDALERLTARLLQRDGLVLVRAGGGPGDQGVDLIALTPGDVRIAVQCKFRQRRPIGPEVVYVLNGTARDLHDARIAVVVTNQQFSDQAIQDARTLGVHLVDGHRLDLWATWGESLYDLIGHTVSPSLPDLAGTDAS